MYEWKNDDKLLIVFTHYTMDLSLSRNNEWITQIGGLRSIVLTGAVLFLINTIKLKDIYKASQTTRTTLIKRMVGNVTHICWIFVM